MYKERGKFAGQRLHHGQVRRPNSSQNQTKTHISDDFFKDLAKLEKDLTVTEMLMLYDEHVNIKIATGLKTVSQALISKLEEGIGEFRANKQLVRDEVNRHFKDIHGKEACNFSALSTTSAQKPLSGQNSRL